MDPCTWRQLAGKVKMPGRNISYHRVAASKRIVCQEDHWLAIRRDLYCARTRTLAGKFSLYQACQCSFSRQPQPYPAGMWGNMPALRSKIVHSI